MLVARTGWKRTLIEARRSLSPLLRSEEAAIVSGEAITSSDSEPRVLEVFDKFLPASAGPLSSVLQAGPTDAARVCSALRNEGLEAARSLNAYDSRRVLEGVASDIERDAEALAGLVALEGGKCLGDARVEVERCAEVFRLAAACAVDAMGGTFGDAGDSARTVGYDMLTRRYPGPPALLVTPFNFPLNLAAHKVAPAIAARVPFALKPSDSTPLSALWLARACVAHGFPPTSVHAVPTTAQTASLLARDGTFGHISFTGSSEVGWRVRRAAPDGCEVTLELGGAAPVLVDETAAEGHPGGLRGIAERIAFGAFFQAGQSCVSVQRVVAHESVCDELTACIAEEAEAWTRASGDHMDPRSRLGPLISRGAADRVAAAVAAAVAEGGAEVVAGSRILSGRATRGTAETGGIGGIGGVGGTRAEAEDAGSVLPAVVVALSGPHRFNACEIFGPVVTVEPYSGDFSAAVRALNSACHGLQAGVFTGSLPRAMDAARALEYGGVVVNDIPSVRADGQPYGGLKESGLGREGLKYAIEALSDLKCVLIKK